VWRGGGERRGIPRFLLGGGCSGGDGARPSTQRQGEPPRLHLGYRVGQDHGVQTIRGLLTQWKRGGVYYVAPFGCPSGSFASKESTLLLNSRYVSRPNDARDCAREVAGDRGGYRASVRESAGSLRFCDSIARVARHVAASPTGAANTSRSLRRTATSAPFASGALSSHCAHKCQHRPAQHFHRLPQALGGSNSFSLGTIFGHVRCDVTTNMCCANRVSAVCIAPRPPLEQSSRRTPSIRRTSFVEPI
jgi:hypothetical protein